MGRGSRVVQTHRWTLFLAAALAAGAPSFAATPVADALQRPALAVSAPQRAVLLAGAQAGARVIAVGERGIVALSDDSGKTWRQAPCPVSVTLTMVRFADDRNGVAVGHGGTVLTTADGGASWSVRLDGRRAAQLAKEAATTPAAQRDAERLVADGPDKPFLDVLVWDAKRFLVVGAYGLVFHTADGGATWTPWMARLPNPKSRHWYVARRSGNALWLAGEQGLVTRSTDGGETFQPVASPYQGSWFAGALQPDGGVLLAGLRGNVWRTADAVNWTQIPSPVPASITAVATAEDGRLLLASQAGLVLVLQGDRLVPLGSVSVPNPAGLLQLQGGALLSVGINGVLPALEVRP
ncbi:YCF48-related protein [Ramlibacter sp. WS9]|uniref:WD40/YVTN/BNR-like repeat-containing protein n=1 Tax=Ramlibacter sp. WS9 TaxID=1882741 RepID=UPI001305192A|nr:YCF48-related protein [Ramlibacter sp. WS9]